MDGFSFSLSWKTWSPVSGEVFEYVAIFVRLLHPVLGLERVRSGLSVQPICYSSVENLDFIPT
jgi:hypothetical protein